MKYRNEWKHYLNYSDFVILKSRLNAVMKLDSHVGPSGFYEIKSLYFDTPSDKALREKLDGVNNREKYRIRMYNDDTSFISLEKKSKLNGLCSKESTLLSLDQTDAIINGNIDWMYLSENKLLNDLFIKMRTTGLAPKTIVAYSRLPFVYAPGNVRVTVDYNIRTGLHSTDFLNPNCITIPATDNTPDGKVILLEVKWDEYLPSIIRDIVQLDGRRSTAFSKYAACRIYG